MDNKALGKVLVYEGKCTDHYIPTIFYTGKWKGPDEFVIKDKNKELELQVFVTKNRVNIVNLTKYENPPFFEMMKAGKTNEDAQKDWLHSLPPGIAIAPGWSLL